MDEQYVENNEKQKYDSVGCDHSKLSYYSKSFISFLTPLIRCLEDASCTNSCCLITGCEIENGVDLAKAISMAIGRGYIEFDCSKNNRLGDLCIPFTNMEEGNIFILSNANIFIKPEEDYVDLLTNAIMNKKIKLTTGRGPCADHVIINLDEFKTVIVIGEANKIPEFMMDLIDLCIDLNDYCNEFEKAYIRESFDKRGLAVKEDVVEEVVNMKLTRKQLAFFLLSTRSKAIELGTREVTHNIIKDFNIEEMYF